MSPTWKIRSLPPLSPSGRITAALASQISDGATAILIANDRAVNEYGLKPAGRVHHMSVLVLTRSSCSRHPSPPPSTRCGIRHDTRSDRPNRNQRSLRFRGHCLVQRDRRRSRQGERQRRRHSPWPPDRCYGHAPDGDAAQRTRAHGRPLRITNNVRRGPPTNVTIIERL